MAENGKRNSEFIPPQNPVSQEESIPMWNRVFLALKNRIPFGKSDLDSAKISDKQLQKARELSKHFDFSTYALRELDASYMRDIYGYENSDYTYSLDRHTKYVEYETIEDRFPEVSNALDIYADECTQKNADGDVFTVHSDNPLVKQILDTLFWERLNFNSEAWQIIRAMVHKGDHFAEIIVDKSGVSRLKHRAANNMYVIYDSIAETVKGYAFNPTRSAPTNGYFSYPRGVDEDLVYYSPARVAQFSLRDVRTFPYGRSLLEKIRSLSLQMMRLEESMAIYRLSRAPERRIFYIDTRGVPPQKQKQFIKQIRDEIKSKKVLHEHTGLVSRYRAVGFDEDYFIPVRQEGSATRIDTLPGAQNLGDIADVEYFQNKYYAGLGISKAYLGREEMMNARSTLVQTDVRFAKKASRIQEDFIRGCYQIAWVELAMHPDINLEDVEFYLEPTLTSYVDELSRLEVSQERLTLGRDLRDAGFADDYYVQTKILKMSPQDIEDMQERSLVAPAEGGGGGGGRKTGGGGGSFFGGGGEEKPEEPFKPEETPPPGGPAPEGPEGEAPPPETTDSGTEIPAPELELAHTRRDAKFSLSEIERSAWKLRRKATTEREDRKRKAEFLGIRSQLRQEGLLETKTLKENAQREISAEEAAKYEVL